MTCGCSTKLAWGDRMATRAALCLTCPKARRGRRRPEPILCTLDGRRLRQKVSDRRARCARWPDGLGRVRWLGMLWRGVPAPRRWLLEHRGLAGAADLGGCGCLDGPRGVWSEEDGTWDLELIAGRVRARLRRWATGETRPARSAAGCSCRK